MLLSTARQQGSNNFNGICGACQPPEVSDSVSGFIRSAAVRAITKRTSSVAR